MIIYNKYLPFKGFKAMAIYPFIFVRGNDISEKTINHEQIHFAQQKELLMIGFYLLYIIFSIKYGYKNNPFEKEANKFENDFNYLDKRKYYNWNDK